MWTLRHRIGWSVQLPAHRATDLDEPKITAWRDERRPVI
ncbi:winged helix-turn-helix domain-containing protein [Streptomyces sp. NPDC050549]